MTRLVASIYAETTSELEPRAARAWAGGAEAVEIRADTFREAPARLAEFLRSHPNRTWIVTCRSRAEGGRSTQPAPQRAEFLSGAITGTSALVDFEFVDWTGSEPARDLLTTALPTSGSSHPRLILSHHDLDGRPDNLHDLVHQMSTIPGVAAAKIAYNAPHICDTFDALDLMRRHGPNVIAVAMGEDGLWTRLLARKLGAFATYCSLDDDAPAAPGQATLTEMVDDYRWNDIDPDTQLFGVIGDPIAHSMSPLLHNQWLAEFGINGLYLPLLVRRKGDCVRRFLDRCCQREWLDLRGLSVTTPHKSSVLHWAGERADWLARRLGALNTLAFTNNAVHGFNTDCYAAIDSLCAALGCTRPQLCGIKVDVLGTGGAARALVYALPMFGCHVTVFGRSFDKARRMAEEFQAHAAPWENRAHGKGEVLINATSVGMWPDLKESPMPADALRGRRLVFDLIYNPPQTRLLADAAAAGIPTLNGLDMFLRQAAMQFELWTGRRPELESARVLIENAISSEPRASARADLRTPRTLRDSYDRKSIALMGLRGSGKTTVGRALASRLGVPFIDTDEQIAAEAGKSIAEIFATEGESGFRRRERAAVAEAVRRTPAVISVGGGAILDAQNVTALRSVAIIVWLTATPEVLWQRINKDQTTPQSRPALTGLADQDEIEHLLHTRRSYYESAADTAIDTSHCGPEQVAGEIAALVGPPR